jgi:hypothetical protein
MPRIFKIIFLVQIGVGAGVAGIVHACNFTVAGAGAFPRIAKLSNVLIARFSAHVIGHHLLGMVDGPRPSDDIMRAAQAMCGSGVGMANGPNEQSCFAAADRGSAAARVRRDRVAGGLT